MSLVGEMANTIIHDIRGPFQSVQLASDLLQDLYPDDQARDICRGISAQIARVSIMAEELLEFSRGSSKVKLEKVDLADLMDEFEYLNKDLLRANAIPVEFSVESAPIEVDRHKMVRTVQNLLNNALEALKGRPEARIVVSAGPVGACAQIRVSDNGPGIPEVIRERLFEAFVTHGKKNGTGLGMAIVQSVVAAPSRKDLVRNGHWPGDDLLHRVAASRLARASSRVLAVARCHFRSFPRGSRATR